ncbi:retinal short-chain dehydrogenase/reductase [Panus rudis PR-1116 ss-1]|nr:retinal short-chain dehydrogenase/reductase [Panus rudis PR-1116 ss-1]
MDSEELPQSYEASPIFDALDVDLVVKVLSHTAFSPFFTFFIPVFYYFQGARWPSPVIVYSAGYFVALCLFWFVKWYSRLYRNQGSLLFAHPPLDWGEQIVVVTGGSSGIGELIANTLAVRNVTVAVLDIHPIVTENYNITYYKCDVSKWEEVDAVSKRIVEELGHPTVLINNAGVVQGKRILDLTPEDIQQTFAVNTLAHFWTLKAFLPEMIKNNFGHIINIASVAGLVGMAKMTDYCASKAAIVSLHESLRYELDHQYRAPSVRTTLVLPGHVHTRLFSTVKLPQSKLYKFFVPSLPPVVVAKAVIAAMDEQHSRTIYLPFYAHFIPFLQLMPSFIRDFAQWLSGADYGMDEFVKISGKRPEEGPAPEISDRSKSD